MNLRETILKEHTKANCMKIVKWVGDDQEKFNRLFDLFLHDEYRVVQRSAWPVSYCVEAHPALIKKNFSKLIRNLSTPHLHDASKRNTMRLLQFVDIPEKYHGAIMDTCFRYISSPTEAPAIKAFSLSVLQKLASIYPEIKNEVRLIIEEQWDHESAAFKSRARRFLKEL